MVLHRGKGFHRILEISPKVLLLPYLLSNEMSFRGVYDINKTRVIFSFDLKWHVTKKGDRDG